MIHGVRDVCGDFVSSPQALSGVKSAQYVDTDIQFSCFSCIKRQKHRYHYTEHLFVCQEVLEKFSIVRKKSKVHIPKEVEIPAVL